MKRNIRWVGLFYGNITAQSKLTSGCFVFSQNALSTFVKVEHHQCTECRQETKSTTYNHSYRHITNICCTIYV